VGRVEAIDEHGVDVKVTTLTGFPAYGPPIGLAVTATCLDDAMPAGTGFSQLLNLRVFQQYPPFCDIHGCRSWPPRSSARGGGMSIAITAAVMRLRNRSPRQYRQPLRDAFSPKSIQAALSAICASRSIFAAMMKSFSWRPLIFLVRSDTVP
jgi:hypothetical protein